MRGRAESGVKIKMLTRPQMSATTLSGHFTPPARRHDGHGGCRQAQAQGRPWGKADACWDSYHQSWMAASWHHPLLGPWWGSFLVEREL
jgi:hypothetical protein